MNHVKMLTVSVLILPQEVLHQKFLKLVFYLKSSILILGPGSDSEAHILPLLGRPTFNRSNKFVYYTATDKYNQVRIPISHNGRDCGGEYGCDEIMDGDSITIPELNGTFKAKIYENTSLHYIPY